MNYIGNGNGELCLTNIARLDGNVTFCNDSSGIIDFGGKLSDKSKFSKLGNGIGKIRVLSTIFEGDCDIYSESRDTVYIDTPIVSRGFKFINKAKGNLVQLRKGFTMEPDTTFIFEDKGSGLNSLTNNGESIVLHSGKITVSGKGNSIIGLKVAFGGNINIITDGGGQLSLLNGKIDWNGETIRFKYNRSKTGNTYINLYTKDIADYLYVETNVFLSLFGSYADNTKILVNSPDGFGRIFLYGDYNSTVSINYSGTENSCLIAYNDKINDLHFNADNDGMLYIEKKVELGSNVTINHYSHCRLYFRNGITIGDGAVINVAASNTKNIEITTDIPAGAVVNY